MRIIMTLFCVTGLLAFALCAEDLAARYGDTCGITLTITK